MEFAEPLRLYALLGLVPIVLLSLVLYVTGRRVLPVLLDTPGFGGTYTLVFLLRLLCFLLFYSSTVVALAGPRWGAEYQRDERRGLEVCFVVDVSRSMLARDVSPNRLERAKVIIGTVAPRTPGVRAGLVLFRGTAVRLLPMTEDPVALQSAIDSVRIESITSPGTNLERGLDEAIDSFLPDPSTGKMIVVFSDGEGLEGDPLRSARTAAQSGIVIHVVGTGTREGAQIPLADGSLVADSDGNPVTTRLEPAMLSELARIGGGNFYSSHDTGLFRVLENEFTRAISSEGTAFALHKPERYVLFIALALVWFGLYQLLGVVSWKR